MSFSTFQHSRPRQFSLVLASFLQQPGLPFSDVLTEEAIQKAFDDAGASFLSPEDDPHVVYTAPVTLWAMLSQALFVGVHRSCQAVTAQVAAYYASMGRDVSDNTGAYCRARQKVPVEVLHSLTVDVGAGVENRIPKKWLWKGRHVSLVDGTTKSMPDTPANQEAWPQPTTQQPGLGFPIVRMVLLISLATGLVHDMALGPYQGKETGELALFRQLLDRIRQGDVILADRYFCTYFLFAALRLLDADLVARLHQLRIEDDPHARMLGRGDHLVAWQRPQQPDWMDDETYASMPKSIEIRLVKTTIHQKGFRTRSLTVATTLTDSTEYTAADLSELYRQRWLAEIDIRSIKSTMEMDVLRCKSPETVRRELWTALLAYNLIRQSMVTASLQSQCSPRQLSFAAALQKVATSLKTAYLLNAEQLTQMIAAHLKAMVHNIVGDRPDRVEPRAIKRRPKKQKLLMQPRDEARAALLAATS